MQETQETQVQSLGWEDPLEEGMATHSNIYVWGSPWTKENWRATVHTVTKSQIQLKQLSMQALGSKKLLSQWKTLALAYGPFPRLKPCHHHLELLQNPQIQLPSPMPLDSLLLSDLSLHSTSVPQVITSPQTLSASTVSLPPVSLIFKSFSDHGPPALSLSVQLSLAAPSPKHCSASFSSFGTSRSLTVSLYTNILAFAFPPLISFLSRLKLLSHHFSNENHLLNNLNYLHLLSFDCIYLQTIRFGESNYFLCVI